MVFQTPLFINAFCDNLGFESDHMIDKFFSYLLAIFLSANLVLGCSTMAHAAVPSAGAAEMPLNTGVQMSGCHETKGSKPSDKHGNSAQTMACKTLCSNLLMPFATAQVRPMALVRPCNVPNLFFPTWDSSVDPPHPR